MSLVLEALRRVEKPGSRVGTVGVAVSSYRPPPRRAHRVVPLLLGLGAGCLFVLFYGPPLRVRGPGRGVDPADPVFAAPLKPARLKGAAGLPPMLVPSDLEAAQKIATPAVSPRNSFASARADRHEKVRTSVPSLSAPAAPPELVLQAISQRDSQPIAVINDQLVREGDMLGARKIMKIGSETVEVRLPDGRTEIVRFAPQPSATPEETPAAQRP